MNVFQVLVHPIGFIMTQITIISLWNHLPVKNKRDTPLIPMKCITYNWNSSAQRKTLSVNQVHKKHQRVQSRKANDFEHIKS